jgi:tetratricopeptide (TPR) repeat protein
MSEKPATRRRKSPAKQPVTVLEAQPEQALVPYDENLLERARTQWQFGDWQSLAQLNRDTLQHHPDRAKLALLAAAGRLQTGQDAEAKQFIRLAQDWGVSKKLISQILIAGVHNSIGRAAAVGNQQHRALQHFENAIQIGTPGSDAKLLTQARIGEQLNQLGLNVLGGCLKVGAGETAMRVFPSAESSHTGEALPLEEIYQAWQVGRWDFLARLDNAELVSRPNRADLILYAACGYQQLDDMDGLQRCSRLAQEWGCPRDKLKQYLAAGIHNTLALSDTLAGQYESAAKNFTTALTVERAKPKPQIVKNRMRRQLKNMKNIDIEQVFEVIAKHLE